MHDATEAVLLVGPTGTGKTPLGEYLQARGWQGRRCAHFDFGAQLRAAAHGDAGAELDPEAVRLIRHLLATGALLEDHQFPIAQRLLELFIRKHRLESEDLLVLNGLPRHVGQATAIDTLARVGRVLRLHCSAATVYARIASNAGGDRGERVDDGVALVQRKLDIFEERTAPLIAHYRKNGVPITDLEVAPDTTAADLYACLARLDL